MIEGPNYEINCNLRATTQLTNYVIITYFFVIFWVETNATKKWPFYNVISIRNSNIT